MSDAIKPTPNFNTPIPESILTPDKVETRIGTLEFSDGLPSPETTQLVYDNLDFLRGVETFLNGIPSKSNNCVPASSVLAVVTIVISIPRTLSIWS